MLGHRLGIERVLKEGRQRIGQERARREWEVGRAQKEVSMEVREEKGREGWRGGKEIKGKKKGRERTNSVGVIEMLKRKRELEVEAEEGSLKKGTIFRRSNLIGRSPVKAQEGGEEGSVLRAFEGWMEEFKERWVRMDESMEGIRRELEDMRKREEDWRAERERMEKRIGELERKWEKGLRVGEGGKKMEEMEERIKRLERGVG